MVRNILFTILIIVALGILLVPRINFAQTVAPQLFITWKTNTTAPLDYAGKVLPGAGSEIKASAELFYKGAQVDLSRQEIYWYVNDEFMRGGTGIQDLTFRATQFAGDSMDLRIQIPNFQNMLVVKTVEIPVARPEIVIEAPFPRNQVGDSFEVAGVPYFFNVQHLYNLVFSWAVNGNSPETSEDPTHLVVKVLGKGDTRVDLQVKNPASDLEAANQGVVLHTE